MIRLLYVLPCETLLLDKDEVASFINCFESVNVEGNKPEDMADNAALPKAWTVVTLWRREVGLDEPRECESRVDLHGPNGKSVMGGSVKFTVSDEYLNYRNTVSFPAFPIGQQGTYSLKVSRRIAPESDWVEVFSYPIDVVHQFT